MKRLFQTLAIFIAIWVLGSFLGVMFDTARANLWTQSLMWGMLASVILAPVFIFVGTSPSDSADQSAPRPSQAEQPFEVEESVDVNQKEEAREKEGWPYNA